MASEFDPLQKEALWVSLYRAELWQWQLSGRSLKATSELRLRRKIKGLQLESHASSAVVLRRDIREPA
jgi:hypothetical protein